jgi:prepilin-type N-terminal cleavage/methylation domain-containing protein/prepilin-type processing-associated H-X9-DG protein
MKEGPSMADSAARPAHGRFRQEGESGGFTLIEMLVVLMIIAVLSALIVPALSSGRRASMRVQCMNQIRQLGIGIQVYAQDADGTLPGLLPSCEQNAPPWLRQDHLAGMSVYSIFGPMGQGVFSDALFICPRKRVSSDADLPAGIWAEGAYEWNLGPGRGWVKMDSIKDATTWPICMDPIAGIHSPGARNIGFLDGHVDMVQEDAYARMLLTAHSNPGVVHNRALICAYYPEDCSP